jgi:ribose 5-phosphate isomerase A
MQSHNLKEISARYAINNFVQPGMNIGLGTGSTAAYAVAALAERIRTENIKVGKLVATSDETTELAMFHGLSIELDLTADFGMLDLTIDGADEVDQNFSLIKGAGGALLREKLVALHTQREVIIVDESKMVDTLGLIYPLPVMVVPYAYQMTAARIEDVLGRRPVLRLTPVGDAFISNDRHYCLDIPPGPIGNPAKVEAEIKAITGVVDVGLFIGLAHTVVVAEQDGRVTVKEKA